MRVAVAQVKPEGGALECNLQRHLELTAVALKHQADLVIFPELSLTGYEPSQAAEIARQPNDSCFEVLQSLCDNSRVSIGVGVPLKTDGLPQISTLIFRPSLEPLIYPKMYLHADEEPFFKPGSNSPALINSEPPIALAICFELSVPAHAERAVAAGAAVYIASVAKTRGGVEHARQRLSEIAADSAIPVLMSNCLGRLDGVDYCGMSCVWNQSGELISQLDDNREGVIVLNLATGDTIAGS